jgi:hypothetical protein
MATKSKKNVIKDQAGKVSDSPDACEVKADSRAAGPDTLDKPTATEWQKALWKKQVGVQESNESVEERYNDAVERCGLNMPLLLQEILREVMYLRAGK